jgi:hypothetical protein
MFRFHFGGLLDLDRRLTTMAAIYGSESVGDVQIRRRLASDGIPF